MMKPPSFKPQAIRSRLAGIATPEKDDVEGDDGSVKKQVYSRTPDRAALRRKALRSRLEQIKSQQSKISDSNKTNS